MDVASTCNTRIKTILVHSFANWLVIKMTRLKTGRLITILVVASTCIFLLFKHGQWEEGDEMVVKHAGSHQQNDVEYSSTDVMADSLMSPLTQRSLTDEITIVTAYWNLGKFSKGLGSLTFDTPLYHNWAKSFRYIRNPVIFYTDSKEFANLVLSLRTSTTLRTKIVLVERNSSWAFRNAETIRRIYSIRGYPRHHPNTVIPEYACAQHAKYDVTARAAKENLFRTTYFAWLDVGYFRDRNSNKTFHLIKPDGFNDSLVAMNEVHRRNHNLTIDQIFRQNIVWLGGGLFLGRHDVIITMEEQFRRAVDYFLSKGVMNTDQQVLYGMYSNEGVQQLNPKIKIKAYWSGGDWFFLGKKMVKEQIVK